MSCPIFTPFSADVGKLILRLLTAILMIPHGINKVIVGVGGIKTMLSNSGIPEFLSYGVYVGEIIAPILLIIGYKSRLGGLLIAITMIFAIAVTSGFSLFKITSLGGFSGELQLLYMFAGICIMLIGPGKFSIDKA